MIARGKRLGRRRRRDEAGELFGRLIHGFGEAVLMTALESGLRCESCGEAVFRLVPPVGITVKPSEDRNELAVSLECGNCAERCHA